MVRTKDSDGIRSGFIVAEVQKRPCLYDTNHSSYGDRAEKMRCWEEVYQVVVPGWQTLGQTEKCAAGMWYYPVRLRMSSLRAERVRRLGLYNRTGCERVHSAAPTCVLFVPSQAILNGHVDCRLRLTLTKKKTICVIKSNAV